MNTRYCAGLAIALTLIMPTGAIAANAPAPVTPFDTSNPSLPAQSSGSSWAEARLSHRLDLARSVYPHIQGCPVQIAAQVISPDNRTLALSSYSYDRGCGTMANNSTLTLWDVQTGQKTATLMRGVAREAFTLPGNRAQEPLEGNTYMAGNVAHAVAFTPDGEWVVAGLSNGTVAVWNARTGEAVRTLSGHHYAVHAIAITPNSRYVVSGSSDQTLKVWNLQTGQLLHTMSLQSSRSIIQRLVMNPDGQTVASITSGNKVQLWNVQRGRLVRTFYDERGLGNPLIPVVFSPDSRYLATGDPIDHTVKLWNAHTGARMLTLPGHQDTVRSLAFSPRSSADRQPPLLVSSSDDNSVRFWNLNNHQREHTLTDVGVESIYNAPPVNRVAFTPDGQTVVIEALLPQTAHDVIPRHGIRLWDLGQRKFVKDISNLSIASGFEVANDGRSLVAVGETPQIWQR